jgi:hypothetical protein
MITRLKEILGGIAEISAWRIIYRSFYNVRCAYILEQGPHDLDVVLLSVDKSVERGSFSEYINGEKTPQLIVSWGVIDERDSGPPILIRRIHQAFFRLP